MIVISIQICLPSQQQQQQQQHHGNPFSAFALLSEKKLYNWSINRTENISSI
jgi:hypothetical protein